MPNFVPVGEWNAQTWAGLFSFLLVSVSPRFDFLEFWNTLSEEWKKKKGFVAIHETKPACSWVHLVGAEGQA